MGIKVKNSNKILVLFIFICLLPIHSIQAVNLGTLISYPNDEPVIDGTFEAGLWDSSTAMNITLYNLDDQSEMLNITMMSIYDRGNTITFGFTIPDASENDDALAIAFKTNMSDDLVLQTPNWGFNVANDIKVYYFVPDQGDDGITDWFELDGRLDTSVGGTDDVAGGDTNVACCYNVELRADLDSGDTNGADFSLAKKDTIEFFVMYLEESSGKIYTQIREADNEWDYCILQVGKPGLAGTNITFVITSLVSTLAVIALITKKRKK